MVKTKKGVTAATLSHPNSRKVRQLTKQVKKEAARKKSKMVHHMKQNLMGERFLWFRDNIPADGIMTVQEIGNTIAKYIGRFDDELDQIQYKHSIGQRKNRQHASREDVLKLTKKQEEEEYKTSGIELPNILEPSQLEMLRKWNGELRFLQNFKLRRFTKLFLTSGNTLSRPASPIHNGRTENVEEDALSNTGVKNENCRQILTKICKKKPSTQMESMETETYDNGL